MSKGSVGQPPRGSRRNLFGKQRTMKKKHQEKFFEHMKMMHEIGGGLILNNK
jgi:hypothetical protein